MRTNRRTIVALLLISVVFFVSACARDLITGKKTYNLYSVDSDSKLGSYVMKSQLKSLKKAKKKYDTKPNKKQLEQIREIVKNIGAVSHYPKFPYEVHLADIDIVNAWCAPGGKMMVYEGLWDPKKGLVKKGNEDELAAVIAHEMAHATARHVTEAISRNTTILAIGSVASSIISAHSAVGGDVFQDIFIEGMNVFIPSYSRKNELEADRVGLFYMAGAGYDPRAAVRLWARAAKKKGDQSSIYASHPSSGIRAKQLKKYLPDAIFIYEESVKKRKRQK